MSKAKSAHYSKILAEHSGNHWALLEIFDKFSHRCSKMHLPDHSSILALENTFSSVFINKTSTIRSSLPSDACSHVLNPPDTRNLICVADDEVRHLVLLAPCKSSDLYPVPTSLVKDCIDILITPITVIMKLSLSEGSFPLHLKSALVSPLLKHPLPIRITRKLSVSNLTSFPWFLRKLQLNHFNPHMNSSNKSNHYQSAYRKFHSAETVLLKIHSNILSSMDAGKVTALTLLDLSIAFNTTDILSSWENFMIGLGFLRRHSTGLNRIWLEESNWEDAFKLI